MAESLKSGKEGSPNGGDPKKPPTKPTTAGKVRRKTTTVVHSTDEEVAFQQDGKDSTPDTGIEGDLAALNMQERATTQDPVGQSDTGTPSKKHGKFLTEHMGLKKATELPGIAERGDPAKLLTGKGYTKASQIFGIYLMENRDLERFQVKMKDLCGIAERYSGDCHKALDEYDKIYTRKLL
eukprot:scpid105183/ scgid30662/ Barrier-to-autointegration factor